ncbi:hypothetical protein [Acanthopleuribacter pedis]|uniref:Uncharacterized protein n=1 Tax=Acanthopleuribacter pedis TaxID=442870 RepID=A0A8J7QAT6_9BACT|nr:hypothetical protein [Acanthopleuribacter pedis]MBO1321027.1 hypothetical protein [Acanthopleuribacter pedis]
MLLTEPIGKVRLAHYRPEKHIFDRCELRYGLRVIRGEEHFVLEDAVSRLSDPWQVQTLATAPTHSTVVNYFLNGALQHMQQRKQAGFGLIDATRPFYPVWDELLRSFPKAELPADFQEMVEAERARREQAFIAAANQRFMDGQAMGLPPHLQPQRPPAGSSRMTPRNRKYQKMVEGLDQMRLFDD